MKLGDVLRRWRQVTDRSLRDVATEIGTTASTLSRIENGEMMDGETLAKVLKWLVSE